MTLGRELLSNIWSDGVYTQVSWSHATNSRADLAHAITTNRVMMIEADVSLGELTIPRQLGVTAQRPKFIESLCEVYFVLKGQGHKIWFG